MSDCEKCGRWIGGLAGECYWCSRLGAVPESERLTYCPFFYRDKRKLVDEPDTTKLLGGRA
jgi:hypothetical protein